MVLLVLLRHKYNFSSGIQTRNHRLILRDGIPLRPEHFDSFTCVIVLLISGEICAVSKRFHGLGKKEWHSCKRVF
jgi:hypothetical protein